MAWRLRYGFIVLATWASGSVVLTLATLLMGIRGAAVPAGAAALAIGIALAWWDHEDGSPIRVSRRRCPDCGEQVVASARICRYCRHEFADGASAVPQAESRITVSKALAIVVALCIIAIVAIGYLLARGPECVPVPIMSPLTGLPLGTTCK